MSPAILKTATQRTRGFSEGFKQRVHQVNPVSQLRDEAAKRLEEQAHCSQDAHGHKHPKEDSVDHHGNIFPVVLHLWVSKGTNA